jgi:Zn-finger nucleic acid-binding protein
VILACHACDSRYDVSGHAPGERVRCRCGVVLVVQTASPQAGLLACPHCGAGVPPTSSTCAHCSHALLLKACPRCLERAFHGHKHCPTCGSELSLAASGAENPERPCPRCEHPLASRLIDDIVIDECNRCHGLFLDQIAIQRVVTDRRQARAEALLGELPRGPAVPRLPPSHKMYIKCPVCHVVMNRRQFAAGAGVVIDVCKAHGTYFDAGELPQILEFVMSGGLERAERKQLERMREQLKREAANAQYAAMMAARSSSHAQSESATHSSALIDLLTTLFR